MDGKTILITGANAGIGKATAIGLAKKGAHVIMLCRNPKKGEVAQQEVISTSGNKNVDLLIGDLSTLKSIRTAADDFKARYTQLHVLVNNAGAYITAHRLTEDGYEYTFALNHLGYFLLTHLLLDVLKSSGQARIVNVSSGAQARGKIDFDDLMFQKKPYNTFQAYCNSKLMNVLFTYELARRLDGSDVTTNVLHPGVVATNFADKVTGFSALVRQVMQLFMISPAKGAETSIYLASSPEVADISGKYWVRKKMRKTSKLSYDQDLASKFWDKSLELAKL